MITRLPFIIRAYLFSPIDIASLVFFRIALGSIMLVEVVRYFRNGWVERYYINPTFHFPYYGFEWLQPWPGDGMVYHFYLLGALAVCIGIGFCFRVTSVLFFFSFAYIFLLDQARYLNHFYLVCLVSFLMMFLPAGRAGSVDAWMRPSIRSRTTPRWTVAILCTQMAIVYFYAALAKFNGDWMRGWPVVEWLAAKQETPIVGILCTKPVTALLFSHLGLLFDLLVVPALLFRRTRRWAFVFVVVFHVTNMWLLHLGIFPWFSIALTTLFLDPSWPRRVLAKKSLKREESDGAKDESNIPWLASSAWTKSQKLTLAFLICYLVVQILLPLRHHGYPGNVNWTEEGYRFAWRMRLHTKKSKARFFVTDSEHPDGWQMNPLEYLDKSQLEKMLLWPDMLIPFCHHVAEHLRDQGYKNVELRVRLASSLHGRRPELLVDPQVDLVSCHRSLKPASWYRPLTVALFERRQRGDFLGLIADSSSLQRHRWNGCGAQSWVETETETVIGDDPPLCEMERVELVSRLCYTTKTRVKGGDYRNAEVLQEVVLGLLPADLGLVPQGDAISEELKIGDDNVKCHVQTYENPLEFGPWKLRIVIWTTDEFQVPFRIARAFGYPMALESNVVRFEIVDQAGDRPNRVTREIVELEVPQKIGDKTMVTVWEKGTFRITDGTGTVSGEIEQWLSPEVPRHIIRRYLRRHESGDFRREIRVRSEVIDFDRVPATAGLRSFQGTKIGN